MRGNLGILEAFLSAEARRKGNFSIKNISLASKSINFASNRWEFMFLERIGFETGMQAGVTGGV